MPQSAPLTQFNLSARGPLVCLTSPKSQERADKGYPKPLDWSVAPLCSAAWRMVSQRSTVKELFGFCVPESVDDAID
ncbi:hypothetical protein ACVWWI_006044 [Bradyrhizobium sp. USDA 3686]|uniref:hypothetical protein n=1 Tax=Bradyrhizobium TaxID=374 RepID=UPI00195D19C8|nr:hypothetical protein [Bradyrhizobium canariense]MBM7488405.1 hypothetical protein [Bradyrhizobium canariense]UFW71053.1 hypothetical protein BcanWU425_30800 [Bradyrhizobium canariense]